MKKLLLAATLATAAGLGFAQGADLKVAIDATYEPFTYKTPDGKPTGFDVDIANALCDQIKRKCVFVEQAWDAMIPGLLAKKCDVIISSMSITEERKRQIDFTDKYYNTPSTVVLKKGDKLGNAFAEIKGKKLGVLKSSTQEKFANGELKKLGATIVPYEAQDQVYLDMKSGRLDGTVADVVEVTNGFLKKPGGDAYAAAGPVLDDPKYVKYFGIGVGVALRKGDDKLKGELNAAIKAIRSNGTYAKINDKYFTFDAYGK